MSEQEKPGQDEGMGEGSKEYADLPRYKEPKITLREKISRVGAKMVQKLYGSPEDSGVQVVPQRQLDRESGANRIENVNKAEEMAYAENPWRTVAQNAQEAAEKGEISQAFADRISRKSDKKAEKEGNKAGKEFEKKEATIEKEAAEIIKAAMRATTDVRRGNFAEPVVEVANDDVGEEALYRAYTILGVDRETVDKQRQQDRVSFGPDVVIQDKIDTDVGLSVHEAYKQNDAKKQISFSELRPGSQKAR